MNSDAPQIVELSVLATDILSVNLFSYCLNSPVIDTDVTGKMSAKQAAAFLDPWIIFGMFAVSLAANFNQGLVAVGGYVTKIITPPVLKAFWWKPWLAAAIIVAAVAIVVAGVAFAVHTYLHANRTLSTVKAKTTNSHVFKLAYVSKSGDLVRVGKSLTFVEALTILGIKKAACSLNRRYTVSATRPELCKSKDWGMYSRDQAYACALAIMLGCKALPEVHGSGMYGHYHDGNHVIHIWFGSPIDYI